MTSATYAWYGTCLLCTSPCGLYADYTEELLDEKEYLQLNREYSQRIEKLKIQADEYRQDVYKRQNIYILGIKVYNIPPEIAGLVTLTKDSLTVQ